MNEKLIHKLSSELKIKLFSEMIKFWKEHKEEVIGPQEIFYINTDVISSLVAHITHYILDEDSSLEKKYRYINEMSKLIKEIIKKQMDDKTDS